MCTVLDTSWGTHGIEKTALGPTSQSIHRRRHHPTRIQRNPGDINANLGNTTDPGRREF
jgi:hypothetical protein